MKSKAWRNWLRRHCPDGLRPLVRRIRAFLRFRSYHSLIAAERRTFDEKTNVHDLPEIFHYWSNKYLRPMFEEFGFSNPDQFFAKYLHEAALRTKSPAPRFLSVGAGNCDTEVRVAKLIRSAGLENFTIECLDLSPEMLERGRLDAQAQGVAQHLIFTKVDFNRWQSAHRYDGVMANQSLHHVLALEHLFDAIKASLQRSGYFITSDMIGRNGHQRWPEALAVVRHFWQELPAAARYNLQVLRQEPQFMDWDCAIDGFEGIRAQDVLPQLLKRFHFNLFIGFSNVIDIFIDRSFGHHLDPKNAKDQDFIDRLHAYDEAAFRRNEYTPTKMVAVMSLDPMSETGIPEAKLCSRGLSAERAVRSKR